VEYRTVIENFHNQVDRDIAEFHKDDVEFMLAMRAALEEQEASRPNTRAGVPTS
jgi:hypothetical protein